MIYGDDVVVTVFKATRRRSWRCVAVRHTQRLLLRALLIGHRLCNRAGCLCGVVGCFCFGPTGMPWKKRGCSFCNVSYYERDE